MRAYKAATTGNKNIVFHCLYPAYLKNFNLANATDSGLNSKSVYFKLKVPTGIKGQCSVAVYVTPVEG